MGALHQASGAPAPQALGRAARGSHGHPLPITRPHCRPWCFRPPVGLPLLVPVGLLVALMRAASPHTGASPSWGRGGLVTHFKQTRPLPAWKRLRLGSLMCPGGWRVGSLWAWKDSCSPDPRPPALWSGGGGGLQECLCSGHQHLPAQHLLDSSMTIPGGYTHFTDGQVEARFRETDLLPAGRGQAGSGLRT